MRDFPSLSCAASGQQVARFLCPALKELVDLELVGKKNWVKLVTKQSSEMATPPGEPTITGIHITSYNQR